MEAQNKEDASPKSTSVDNHEAPTAFPTFGSPASAPTLSLRFPRPQGSIRLANWVSNSSPDILQAHTMSESSSLADSAYEFITAGDTENPDDRTSELTSSLEITRPDDINSLDGSEEHYDSESEDESGHSSHGSLLRYADEALRSPSSQALPGAISYGSPSPDRRGGSITFEECNDEPESPGIIRAKHVIYEYTEDEVADIAKRLNLPDMPRHLVATARQNMSRSPLSLKEPLRLLYVGQPEMKRELVMKFSNALWASYKDDPPHEGSVPENGKGIYNIVPISSFGSTPELELMEASQYQIKIDHCVSALDDSTRDEQTVYSITVGNHIEKTYSTVVSTDGDITLPCWERPHIAIFFCAGNEDESEKETREAAWKFMKANKVPCIFISESQLLSTLLKKPLPATWQEPIDRNIIHLSLESGDQETGIVRERLPIDLTTFVNIDARQMSQHLAYLIGSAEIEQVPLLTSVTVEQAMKKLWDERPSRNQMLQCIEENKWFIALVVPLLMTLLAPLIFAFIPGSSPVQNIQPVSKAQAPDVRIVSSAVCDKAPSALSALTSTTTKTVVVDVTSTRTVQLSLASPSTSSLASVLPFAGFLSDRPSDIPTEAEQKKNLCSVNIHGPNTLQVTLPSGSNAWIARSAVDIRVNRGGEKLAIKLTPANEALIVELDEKEAYGILDISVVTTRRPKIDETIRVDLGTAGMMGPLEAGLHALQDATKAIFSEERLRLAADSLSTIRHRIEEGVSHGRQQSKLARAKWQFSVLEAQISAKAWWLELQGNKAEAAEYQHKAARFLEAKQREILEAFGGAPATRSTDKDSGTPDEARMARLFKKLIGEKSLD